MYKYKHLAVEHYFLALDIWRKCPLPRVLVDHFSKVYRWINVAKTYKFFSGASPPNPQFFSPQLCDETHELHFEYLTFNWSVSSVKWWISSVKWWISSLNWWISSLNWWISSLNSWPINATRTPNFLCLRILIKLGVYTFLAQIIFSHWLALHNHSENFLLMIYSVSECML